MTPIAAVSGFLVGAAVLGAMRGPSRPRRVDDLRLPLDGRRRVGRGLRRDDPRLCALALVLTGVCWAMHPLLAIAVVGAMTVGEPLCAHRASGRRGAEISASLPDVIDLFRSSVDAGLTVGAAIDAVASRTDGAWRLALLEVQRQVALGERRAVALHELDELGDAARPLLRALVASERDGAPLGVVLDALARDARLERRRDAEERARRLPIKLLFPLVLCILPAFGLLTVVPLLAGTIPSLTG